MTDLVLLGAGEYRGLLVPRWYTLEETSGARIDHSIDGTSWSSPGVVDACLTVEAYWLPEGSESLTLRPDEYLPTLRVIWGLYDWRMASFESTDSLRDVPPIGEEFDCDPPTYRTVSVVFLADEPPVEDVRILDVSK